MADAGQCLIPRQLAQSGDVPRSRCARAPGNFRVLKLDWSSQRPAHLEQGGAPGFCARAQPLARGTRT